MVTPDKYYIVIGDQSKYEEHGGKPNDKSPRIYPNTTIFRGANYHPHMVCTQIQVEAAMKSEVQPGLTHGFTAQS